MASNANKHTAEELVSLQSLPLDIKIRKTENRIREWYEYFDGDVYVSFSGGKDSTVLLDIARRLYPDIEAVYCDTGLEYPEIKEFIKTFQNTTIIHPKYSFKEIINKYGYPLVSKEVGNVIDGARAFMTKYITGSKHVDNAVEQFEQFIMNNIPEYLDRGGWSAQRLYPPKLVDSMINMKVAKVAGVLTKDNRVARNIPKGNKSGFSQAKWRFLLDADFKISDKCCYHMKKAPMSKYEKQSGKKPIIATMTEDSLLRRSVWLKVGCNAFDGKRKMSKPMSFWTEQDVLQYIDEHDINYCSVYGDLIKNNGEYSFSGCKRTGCVFCGFGCHLEPPPNRFKLLKESHPQLYNYCIGGGEYDEDGWWHPSKNGLGMSHILDFINVEY